MSLSFSHRSTYHGRNTATEHDRLSTPIAQNQIQTRPIFLSFLLAYMLVAATAPNAAAGSAPPKIIVPLLYSKKPSPLEGEVDGAVKKALAESKAFALTSKKVKMPAQNDKEKEGKEGAKKAKELFAKGKEFFNNLQMREGIDLFREAASLYEQHFPYFKGFDDYEDALTYWGLSLQSLNDTSGAKEIFERLLAFNPEKIINKNDFPPKLIGFFEREKARILAKDRGHLKIEVENVETASIYVNGVKRSGFVRNLVVGNHYVIIKKSGYDSFTQAVEVKPGRNTLTISLKKQNAARQAKFFRAISVGSASAQRQIEFLKAFSDLNNVPIILLSKLIPIAEDEVKLTLQLYDGRSGEPSEWMTEIIKSGDTGDVAKKLVQELETCLDDGGQVLTTCKVKGDPDAKVRDKEEEKEDLRATDDEGNVLPLVEDDTPFYKRWWFLAAGGTVAVVGGVYAFLAVQKSMQPKSSSSDCAYPDKNHPVCVVQDTQIVQGTFKVAAPQQ